MCFVSFRLPSSSRSFDLPLAKHTCCLSGRPQTTRQHDAPAPSLKGRKKALIYTLRSLLYLLVLSCLHVCRDHAAYTICFHDGAPRRRPSRSARRSTSPRTTSVVGVGVASTGTSTDIDIIIIAVVAVTTDAQSINHGPCTE